MLLKNNIDGSKSRINAVAIGTSAGGIEALGRLLPHIPKGCGKVFLVVQHITPDSDSTFVRLIRDKCNIRVREACNTDEIIPGTIYFAPPDYHLLVEKNFTLSLGVDEKINFSRPSIDVLFETAAETFRQDLTGILLTGVNRDGSAGLKRIQQLGGKTIVQSPEDADFSEMPLSAIKLFKPDQVLTLGEIADYLRSC
ncbi:MAG TPA: chemotaxis protein CheB [Bacteroidales bacterium]|nr:chemotaxis protein CheB [Bacteroidales bacterium]